MLADDEIWCCKGLDGMVGDAGESAEGVIRGGRVARRSQDCRQSRAAEAGGSTGGGAGME